MGAFTLRFFVAVFSSGVLLVSIPSRGASVDAVEDFGANPGALTMYEYVPDSAGTNPPLVVLLHGCGESAQQFAAVSGWRELARRWGLVLLMAEQTLTNNAGGCFNWFESSDVARGQGEAASIASMIAAMKTRHAIDESRVFIFGFSAGGAMAQVMLATYPELFRAGASVAGVPYGCAQGVSSAFACMDPGKDEGGEIWGDAVRSASSHSGPWPRVAIIHGLLDATVDAKNATELAEQWLNVHGLDAEATSIFDDGAKVFSVWEKSGVPAVEKEVLTAWGHAVPIDLAAGNCGAAGGSAADASYCLSLDLASRWELMPEAASVALSIVSPVDGTRVSGTVFVDAEVVGEATIESVELVVDGTPVDLRFAHPWGFTWFSNGAGAGEHELELRATLATGGLVSSETVSVIVGELGDGDANQNANSGPSETDELSDGCTSVSPSFVTLLAALAMLLWQRRIAPGDDP